VGSVLEPDDDRGPETARSGSREFQARAEPLRRTVAADLADQDWVQHAVHRLTPARPELLGHVASLLDLAQDHQNAVERSSHHPLRVMHCSASAEKVDHIVDTLSHQGACRMSDEWAGLVRSTPHLKASS
jgi:hypothetical protein